MAAGEGRRAGSEIPKQFVKLLGIPMLWWSVMAFHKADASMRVRIVMHPGFFDDLDIMLRELPEDLARAGFDPSLAGIPVELVCGGRTRSESVKNGLMAIPDTDAHIVAVHDAARPLVTPEIIDDCMGAAEKTGGCSLPVVPVTDSLRRRAGIGSMESEPVDRNEFLAVQTPQCAPAALLHRAFRLTGNMEFTDEASRIQSLGTPEARIVLCKGAHENMKVTGPADFLIAETLLRKINE